MNYFATDIIELSEEEHLEHSRFGSFRKSHKYIDRVWKGGRWVYRYAKKAAGKVYGSEYRKDMDKYNDMEDRKLKNKSDVASRSHALNKAYIDAQKAGDKEGMKKAQETIRRSNEYYDRESAEFNRAYNRSIYSAEKYFKSPAYQVDKLTGNYDKTRAERERKKGNDWAADRYEESYNNAPAVKAKKAVKSAAKAIKDKLTPKETATVKDTMTGKTKSVDPNDAIYKKLEKEAKKSKKIKHSDILDTVALGEVTINELFGRD